MQRELIIAPDDDALAAVCLAILSRTGIASDHTMVSAALLDQLADQPPTRRLVTPPPRQWLPVQVYAEGETLLVEWLHFGFAPLSEPFFEQSVARARALPANRLLRCATPLAALSTLDNAPPPDGLIFHMSRCGSTLVAQMIAALDRTVVVSEAPPLDLALQLYLRAMVPAAVVRGMMAALTRERSGKTEHRVVKLDAWHALAIDQLAALFPEARRAFVFRDAAEVLVSQARRPGLHVVPGHVALDAFGVTGAETITAADYPAWVLDRICRTACDAAAVDPALLLIDYVELPGAVTNRILPHFGIVADRKAAAAMAEASVCDTKCAGKIFTSDGNRKRAEADGPMRSRHAAQLSETVVRLGDLRRAAPADRTPAPIEVRPTGPTVSISFGPRRPR